MKLALVNPVFLALSATLLPTPINASRSDLINGNCEHNTYMCCWTENDGQGMQDNTDVCNTTANNGRVRDFAGNAEGDVHCHGFVWQDDSHLESFIIPLFNYVKKFDHVEERGYYGSLAGSSACGCIEKMAVVSRADCTTYSVNGLVACTDNDLRTHYDETMNKPRGDMDFNLVATCDNAA